MRSNSMSSALRLLVVVACTILYANACSGAEPELLADAGVGAGQPEPAATVGDGSQPEADRDFFEELVASADWVTVERAGNGRLMIGVDCLEGHSKPTGTLTMVGEGLTPGEHEFTVSPSTSSRKKLIVQAEQVQDLPAGATYYAAQTGFDAEEYVFDFASLDTRLTLPGCG